MPFVANVIKIMIASPSDVQEERSIIREVIADWNSINAEQRKTILLPIGWETNTSPEMGNRPQAIINKQVLKNCDILIGVFWSRIGTDTGIYQSGTIEEIEEHLKLNKPVMLYFSNKPINPYSVNQLQFSRVSEFKESCKGRGLIETYDDVAEFRKKFYNQLQLKLNDLQFTFATPVPNDEQINLSLEAAELLREACNSEDGCLIRTPYSSGILIFVNDRQLPSETHRKSIALWEDAIVELEEQYFIRAQDYERKTFYVTKDGYAYNDGTYRQ